MGICCGQFADHVAVPVGVDETITAHRLGMERPERKTIRSFTIKSMDYFVLFSGDVGISVSGRAISTETAETRATGCDAEGEPRQVPAPRCSAERRRAADDWQVSSGPPRALPQHHWGLVGDGSKCATRLIGRVVFA